MLQKMIQQEHLEALKKLRELPVIDLLMAHDYHPYGNEVYGTEEIHKCLDICAEALLKVKEVVAAHPELDDQAAADLYNKDSGLPAVPAFVVEAIRNAYGEGATRYLDNLIRDINGGVRSDPRESVAKKLIGLQKKAAVLNSFSVIIQQPSAIARALSEINARYFDYQPKIINHKRLWTELKQYAPVAIIKEMGRFDTDVGVSTVDYIIGKKKFRDKLDDVAGFAPALMDELTWVHIWTAVKRETLAKIKKENGGKHTALNASHPHIHGKYVLILDSDDYLSDDAVAAVCRSWEESLPAL